MSDGVGNVLARGLWSGNPALVQLLGLCPLLAVSTTIVQGIALGVATTLVLILSNLIASLTRRVLPAQIRLLFFAVVIATLVSLVDLLMSAWFDALHRSLGIFVPLIVCNCTILARAEHYAAQHKPLPALMDAVAMGAGFSAVLILLGGLREMLGQGTLFAGIAQLRGGHATGGGLLIPGIDGFLLATLPPGAFLALGLLIALRNALAARQKQPDATPEASATAQ